MSVSKTLIKEIRNIALITVALGIVQLIITKITGFFGYPAVLGTLLGCFVAVINFALMGFILERCVSRNTGSSGLMGFGYIVRLGLIALAIVWAIKVTYLNYVCVIIPLLFPQIAIFIINALRKKERKAEEDGRT